MTNDLPPSGTPSSNQVPMQHLDGLTPATPAVTAAVVNEPSPELQKKANSVKKLLVTLGIGIYVIYGLWCAVLMAMLPSANPGSASLVQLGVMSALIGGVSFLVFIGVAFLRISKADVAIITRKKSLVRAAIIAVPGLLLSVVVPLKISGQPPLSIDIISPTNASDFIAPLAITFSAEKAVTLLREQNLRPVRFVWDFESDGEPNDETVLPLTTAIYEKSGVYTMSARIDLEGGETRTLYRRISIPTAVFSVSPMPPIVEQTVRFSVTHLLSDPKLLAEVDWDFDGDGQKDATVKTTDVAHTYYATGNYNVSATIRLNNQSQRTLSRMIEVTEPAPLPFPVTLTTEPATLVGPAPFGAGFTLETKEPIREIQWTFGDDKEERGASLKKVLHSFDQPGIYPVTAKVRSASGKLAEITTIVRVTEVLQLSDLRFDMQPPLRNSSVSGEVPLNVTITPLTSVPLIQFAWEAPGASAVSKTGSTLTATYRKEGNYQITLIAEDPEGKVLRYPINVKANPPQADIVINLRPSTGTAPLRVEFDVSNSYIPPGQNVIGYEWTYGDEKQAGAKPELGLAKTEHVYQQPGEYTVNLRIVLSDGKDYKAQQKVVVRRPTLSACITQSRLRAPVQGTIEFIASECSTGAATSYLWDVRSVNNPGVIIAQSPMDRYQHFFEASGDYTITLTIKDQFGNQSTASSLVTITP